VRIRQALLDLLPSQHDVDLICEASEAWLLISAMISDTKHDETSVASWFSVTDLNKKGPTQIARTLLYIAVSLQQLDAEFDTSRLQMFPSIESRIERYISTVQSLVISDDELISSLEGLECLMLQGLYHINAGNPRRAWLISRKAIGIGQLLGIHKNKSPSVPVEVDMWYHLVQVDRYLVSITILQQVFDLLC